MKGLVSDVKNSSIILLCVFLAGCGGSLSHSWDNFTAYYNTFYNAKKDFRAGVKKVEKQPVQLAPEAPVRPHPAPVRAGAEDFEEAINKAALVLRRHADSKWTDNALLLIGKSYYYQQEFFLAVQTFEQLIDSSAPTSLKQQAILWKGRALLDIGSYGEGIQFLETQLTDLTEQWDATLEAEAKVMLGEHFAMLEDWEASSQVLEPAILRLNDNELKGRSYFLLGQVLEQRSDFNRAFQAYSNVAKYYPDYEYIYWANIKRAEVSRRNRNTELAVSIYQSMLNDDKNTDRRNSILFELAQTYEQQAEPGQAKAIYKRILSDPASQRSALVADTYYQLGQLYGREYENYQLAAAYYDSSSAVVTQRSQNNPEEATELASAYGDYLSLKNEIAGVDSLLQLGSLNERERDSVLAEVRRNRRAMRISKSRKQQPDKTLTNARADDGSSLENPGAEVATYGFLNYRNARMVAAGKQQFRTRWGNRPLVDNWRRTNAIQSTSDETPIDASENSKNIITEGQFSDRELGINLADIPMNPQAVNDLRSKRLRLKYQLGSLFFLTLNKPDSARYYFDQVLQDSINSSVAPQALYSLFRLYERDGNTDRAAFYRNQVITRYPQSIYANRLIEQEEGGTASIPDSARVLRQHVQQLLFNKEQGPASSARADTLVALARENRNSTLAPAIFYKGIKEYIRVAKNSQRGVTDSTNTHTKESWAPDSLQYPATKYGGENWDHVRELIREFKELFPEADQTKQVGQWARMLDQTTQNSRLTCAELGVTPSIRPGMETFLRAVQLPEKIRKMNLSGSITYRIVISREGQVESYELFSKKTNLGIEEAYEAAIQNELKFDPVHYQNKPVQVSCEVVFPIKQ